jgi:glycerol-3-phosphate dehydrogenase (NAD(P)+)
VVVIGIVGAGAWGTAVGDLVASQGSAALLWSDSAEIAKEINEKHTNERHLPGAALAPVLRATADLAELAGAAQLLLLAVSSPRVEATVRALGEVVNGRHVIVHAIGAQTVTGRVSELLRRETPVKRVGVVAGPAMAKDLVARRPCGIVVASPFDGVTTMVRHALEAPTLRVYRSSDLAGVELASALTGAFTVAFGLADAIGMGTGPRAVLLCRALAEATRLGVASGARERTFAGLAGLGNLVVRASSESSDDYQLGFKLGRGEPPVRRETEGTRAAQALVPLARTLGVRVPILEGLTAVVTGAVTVREMVTRLMESHSDEE